MSSIQGLLQILAVAYLQLMLVPPNADRLVFSSTVIGTKK